MPWVNWLKLVGYFLIPSYRRKQRDKAGWNLVRRACSYLLLKKDCDRDDIEAGRILSAKMKELNHAL